jgi:hypothetical protein
MLAICQVIGGQHADPGAVRASRLRASKPDTATHLQEAKNTSGLSSHPGVSQGNRDAQDIVSSVKEDHRRRPGRRAGEVVVFGGKGESSTSVPESVVVELTDDDLRLDGTLPLRPSVLRLGLWQGCDEQRACGEGGDRENALHVGSEEAR